MATSGAWIQIVVAVIGSSLFGIFLTNLAIDYNQPKIRINVDKTFDNASQKRFDTTIVNEGNSAATNLRLTLHYIGGNITNYRIGFTAENSTSFINPQDQATLVTNESRFAPSSVMLISTTVNNSKAPFYSVNGSKITSNRTNIEYRGNYVNYTGSYFVTATYDQGGIQISSPNITQRAYQPIERVTTFSTAAGLWVGIAIVLFVSATIFIPLLREKLKNKKPGLLLLIIVIVADAGLILLLLIMSGVWLALWT